MSVTLPHAQAYTPHTNTHTPHPIAHPVSLQISELKSRIQTLEGAVADAESARHSLAERIEADRAFRHDEKYARTEEKRAAEEALASERAALRHSEAQRHELISALEKAQTQWAHASHDAAHAKAVAESVQVKHDQQLAASEEMEMEQLEAARVVQAQVQHLLDIARAEDPMRRALEAREAARVHAEREGRLSATASPTFASREHSTSPYYSPHSPPPPSHVPPPPLGVASPIHAQHAPVPDPAPPPPTPTPPAMAPASVAPPPSSRSAEEAASYRQTAALSALRKTITNSYDMSAPVGAGQRSVAWADHVDASSPRQYHTGHYRGSGQQGGQHAFSPSHQPTYQAARPPPEALTLAAVYPGGTPTVAGFPQPRFSPDRDARAAFRVPPREVRRGGGGYDPWA